MKTTIKSDKLTLEIEDIQNQINSKEQELESLKSDLNRFIEENLNLNAPVCQEIRNDAGLSPTQLLAEIERLQSLETARLEKLSNVTRATELFKSQITNVESQLKTLQSELVRLEDERYWQNSYLPYASKYSQTFINEHKVKNDRQISEIKKQIVASQNQLNAIKYFLNNPDPNIKQQFCKIGDRQSLSYLEAEQALSNIPSKIQGLESNLKSYEEYFDNWLENLNANSDFRKFVKARVTLENAAKELSRSANEYLAKLESFKALEADCKPAIRFKADSGYSLNRIRSVVIGDYVEIEDILI